LVIGSPRHSELLSSWHGASYIELPEVTRSELINANA